MLKKSLIVMSISAAFFAQAQDISILRNSIDVYSNTPMFGSSKFNAMAGSNGALGGDASSLLTNPAGLGLLFREMFLRHFLSAITKTRVHWLVLQ
jgi:hypothetical protein